MCQMLPRSGVNAWFCVAADLYRSCFRGRYGAVSMEESWGCRRTKTAGREPRAPGKRAALPLNLAGDPVRMKPAWTPCRVRERKRAWAHGRKPPGAGSSMTAFPLAARPGGPALKRSELLCATPRPASRTTLRAREGTSKKPAEANSGGAARLAKGTGVGTSGRCPHGELPKPRSGCRFARCRSVIADCPAAELSAISASNYPQLHCRAVLHIVKFMLDRSS